MKAVIHASCFGKMRFGAALLELDSKAIVT